MGCIASIVITTFQRANLLEWGLFSLIKQNIPFAFETIVVNDGILDETEAVCQRYQSKLNIKYIFAGQRNLTGIIKWRIPGFPANIGVQHSSGRVLILSCAEMFHQGETISLLTDPILQNPSLLTIPIGKDDQDASFLNLVNQTSGGFDLNLFNNLPALDVHLPFLIAVDSTHFKAIRGYDEDFTGIAFDDNDLVERLQKYGCVYHQTAAMAVHLYHPRYIYQVGENTEWQYNRSLYHARGEQIVRNIGRDWGRI